MTVGGGSVRDSAVTRLVPGAPRESQRLLASVARVEAARPGTRLLREGDPTPYLGVVIDGRLSLQARVPGHPDATLMTLDAGDLFGWSAVLDGTSTASVVALEGSHVMLFDRAALLAAIDSDPGLAVALYRRLLEAVAGRLEATRLQSLDLYRAGAMDP